MRGGLVFATSLHLVVLAALSVGLSPPRVPPAPPPIMVAFAPSKEPPAAMQRTAPPPAPEKPKPAKVEKPKPKPPPKAAAPKQPEPRLAVPEKPRPEPEKPKLAEKPKPEPEKPKPKPAEQDLMAALADLTPELQKEAQKQAPPTPRPAPNSSAAPAADNVAERLSGDEWAALRDQLRQAWLFDAGKKGAHELIVDIIVELDRDGTVLDARVADEYRSAMASDEAFRAFADSALRAPWKAQRLTIPPRVLAQERTLRITFDPRQMF